MNKKCSCGASDTLLFPCSGGSNVGQIANAAAVELTKSGDGAMYCLAGIGGDVGGIVESTKSACRVVAIDGCQLQCAKKTLTRGGRAPDTELIVTDLGIKKGGSIEADGKHVRTVAEKVREML